MAIALEGLEFQIEASSGAAEEGLKSLHNTLTKLRGVLRGGLGLKGVADQLSGLQTAMQKFQGTDTSAISKAVKAIRGIGDVKISSTVAKGLTNISDAATTLMQTDTQKLAVQLSDLSTAIQRFDGTNIKALSRVIDAMYDLGAVRFNSSGVKGLTGMAEAMGKITQTDGQKLVDTLTNTKDAVQRFEGTNTESLSKALRAIRTLSEAQISETIASGLHAIIDASSRITEYDVQLLERYAWALKGLSKTKVSIPSAPIQETAPGMEAMQSEVEDRTLATMSNMERLQYLMSEIKGAFTRLHGAASGALKSIGSAAGQAAAKVGELAKNGAALPLTYGKKLGNAVKGFGARIKDTIKALGRIAFYRLIRTIIKEITKAFSEGMKNMYQYSKLLNGTFYKSMNRLATSAQYLKNSLGAMAAPLMNALAPVIDALVDRMVYLFNVFNQFIARLTGQTTYTAAKKVAAVWSDETKKTAKNVKDAADELKRFVLGFDELNILGDKNKDSSGSGSGSGGDATDYSSMFETRTIEGGISEFADKIKEAISNQNWHGLGEIIGDKINEGFGSVEWDKLGAKIGGFVNAVVETLYSTMDTISFTDIGAHAATMMSNFAAAIDFHDVGGLVVKFKTFLYDMLIGAVTTLDFAVIAEKVGDFFKGVYDEFTKWFESYDWSELGKKLYSQAKTLITNFDYGGIADSMFTMFGTAVRVGWDFISGLFTDLWADITNWWNTSLEGANWGEKLLTAIGNAFKGIGSFVYNHVISPFANALVGANWEDMLKAAPGKIWNAIKTGWQKLIVNTPGHILVISVNIVNHVKDWWENINNWWSTYIKGKSLEEIVLEVKNTASTWWSKVEGWWKTEVTGKVVQFAANVKNEAPKWWSNVKNWWTDYKNKVVMFAASINNDAVNWWKLVKHWWKMQVGKVEEFATGVKNEAAQWWKQVKQWWSEKVGKVAEFTTGLKNDAATWWRHAKKWWRDEIEGKSLKDIVVNLKNNASTWWSNAQTWWDTEVKDKALDISLKIKTSMEDLFNDLQDKWNKFLTDIGGFLEIKIKPVFDSIGGKVSDGASWLWGNVKEGATNAWNGIGDFFFPRGEAEESYYQQNGNSNTQPTVPTLQLDFTATMQTYQTQVSAGWKAITEETAKSFTLLQNTVMTALANLSKGFDIKFKAYKDSVVKGWKTINDETARQFTQLQGTVMQALANLEIGFDLKLNSYYGKVVTSWNRINEVTSTKWTSIQNAIMTSLANLDTGFAQKFASFEASVRNGMLSMENTAERSARSIANSVPSYFGSMARSITGMNWYGIGSEIVYGIGNGINRNWGWLNNMVYNRAMELYKTARMALQIRSPSKLFRDGVGQMLGLGIAEGLSDSQSVILARASEITDALAERVRDANVGSLLAADMSSVQYDNSSDRLSMSDSVRQGITDANARQNELLREQNSLLRQILEKELTANVSFDDFTKAAQRKNRIYGQTVVPVG